MRSAIAASNAKRPLGAVEQGDRHWQIGANDQARTAAEYQPLLIRSHHGRYAIASLWEKDGALIFYDAQTFQEIKRLPASRPVGKYNLFNKINRSEGTSH